MRPLRVFLCHASQDKPAVRKLHRYLKQRGVQPWLDELDLLPGENWEVEIPKALFSSDVILVCLSKNSVDKEGYVQKEISFALDKALEKPEGTIFVVPVKLEDCDVPKRLNRFQWVDLFRQDGYKRLMLGLQKRASGLGGKVSPVLLEDKGDFQNNHTFKWVFIIGIVLLTFIVGGLVLNYLTNNSLYTDAVASSTKMTTFDPAKPTPTLGIGSTIVSEKDGMPLLYIPAGKFSMGSSSSLDEIVHQVELSAFWIDQTEVTNKMYSNCVGAGNCSLPSNADRFRNSVYQNHPVVYVDWEMARAYCSWAGRRLPTEAEWEKSARGADKRIYPWGNQSANSSLLNYNDNVGDTTEAGKYHAGMSAYGAYDMSGNVWEWVHDWYGETYYQNSPLLDPIGPALGTFKVLRGGSWRNGVDTVRSANRYWLDPLNSYDFLGFRCALSAE